MKISLKSSIHQKWNELGINFLSAFTDTNNEGISWTGLHSMKSLPFVHFDDYSYFASWNQKCIALDSGVAGWQSRPKLSAVFGNSHWKWPTATSKELVIVQGAVCSVIFPNSSAAGKFGCPASSNGCLNSFVAWEIVRNKGANVDWHKPVWFSPSVARFGFISWSVIHDKLPTFERINSWSVGSTRFLCLFCNLSIESCCHRFLECSFSNGLQSKVLQLCSVKLITESHCHLILDV
ncbi:uncharacterized protein LOC120286324 [Eucalyptus grandis]|uniref:uncharacterized protein LOC120286324 n=1 Tax=Eucalyptus grandis TaxID=71139 RepID=UPI00192EB922|nr:uncharacterized protein LOC120286324 [Eucalyptus grandis]XP_039160126.1 uncharacterized protein LOC120286324 [Eucalyptus grandis]